MNDMKDIRKALFLLGGHDLEMMTIKETLECEGIAYADHGLGWNGALLSSYGEEIAEAERNGQDIYGIELKEDISLPIGYHRIDHHNDLAANPSSIEQVYELLDITIDRHAELVAANDRGYIPAMRQAGATDEECKAIRREDRKAQGVTENDERLAEQSIKDKKTIGRLIIVKALSSHFSPITDHLWPYKQLLIYTDRELTYYGEKVSWVRNLLKDEDKGTAYSGGGDDGYAGITFKIDSPERIADITLQITRLMCVYSQHVFYFPFKWEIKDRKEKTFTDQINLSKINSNSSQWEKVTDEPKVESERNELFDEKQYYFEFVHPVLYDTGKEKSLLHHFERREPKQGDVEYVILVKQEEGDREYRLNMDSMNLNFYSTGVGVLSLFLTNRKEGLESTDILNINQYGRRIMLPFYGDKTGRGQTAKKLSIIGLKGDPNRYVETFNDVSLSTTWTPAKFILSLMEDLTSNVSVSPVIDDRMLVNCWYPNQEMSDKIKNDSDFIMGNFWYKYAFVDSGNETCQNYEMKKKLLDDCTYKRWQRYGTLYGLTRYSMVAVTDKSEFSYSILSKHMRTIYSQMFELIIVQRASILRFSGEVTQVSKLPNKEREEITKLAEHIKSLYEEYISFVNQMYLTYVTAQDQGIEMYNILMKQFSSSDKVKDLDSEIEKLYRFITIIIEKKQNDTIWTLTVYTLAALPVTVLATIFGMNEIKCGNCWSSSIIIGLIILFVYICIFPKFKRGIIKGLSKLVNK